MRGGCGFGSEIALLNSLCGLGYHIAKSISLEVISRTLSKACFSGDLIMFRTTKSEQGGDY